MYCNIFSSELLQISGKWSWGPNCIVYISGCRSETRFWFPIHIYSLAVHNIPILLSLGRKLPVAGSVFKSYVIYAPLTRELPMFPTTDMTSHVAPNLMTCDKSQCLRLLVQSALPVWHWPFYMFKFQVAQLYTESSCRWSECRASRGGKGFKVAWS